MPSFDVVSEVDQHELANAVDQANREIDTRYDFKGAEAQVEQAGDEGGLQLEAQSEFQIEQMMDILLKKIAKRGIDVRCIERGKLTETGRRATLLVEVKQGIDTDTAKRMVKSVKDSKLKVQAAIQGDKLRVTGKNRDDLQQVMALLRAGDWGRPLQFENLRD
ncbi:YajQ family cyclic di-GMP-binding protein [Acidihalobacter yilgarnensis]|uniref:Nucleotide-binding protein BI364_09055 n=1 Tax=Acidihalobacter yilgarnensis TaxID=2819280 RepID=A0A1D8INQ6_9GAMM|nr:YajQ family cyclic di-GMP-binding protein [Acidihalobacter yilgarnensis]AOU98089.1 YajQ family cyclic di-GMP-binding protein [Acidihalobacter yilgarnensis]